MLLKLMKSKIHRATVTRLTWITRAASELMRTFWNRQASWRASLFMFGTSTTDNAAKPMLYLPPADREKSAWMVRPHGWCKPVTWWLWPRFAGLKRKRQDGMYAGWSSWMKRIEPWN